MLNLESVYMKSFLMFFIFIIFIFEKTCYSEQIKVIKISDSIKYPWGMSLVNKKNVILTSKSGGIFLVNLDEFKTQKIYQVEDSFDYNQGGLLDIIFIKDKLSEYIFVCYNNFSRDLVIARFNINKEKLSNKKLIFNSNFKNKNGRHFGCRLTHYKNTLLASLGDRGKRENSQNPKNYPGSIVQITFDGKKVGKNRDGWLEGIFSIGHRNPQGLIYIKNFDEIWSHEHGPKGGDEINIINKGLNFGWPVVTYGKEYWGGKIGEGVPKKGMTEPVWKWIPSIAPSGMDFYKNTYFKSLNNTLLVGSLKFKSLIAIKIANKKPKSEFIVFKNKIGRIRDVLVHPRGYILLLNDEYDGGLYKVMKK